MASSLFALIDDIATVLDDVSILAKVAIQKTTGVLGDDLALNAEKVAGVVAERELPVVWAVAKGSFLNKLILVPAALTISALLPSAIIPLLMLGGAYLCFEGFEKLAHKFLHSTDEDHHKELVKALANPKVSMVDFEKDKIKGAIRTDFVLSAEIIVISLGTVSGAPFLQQVIVLAGIAVIMTIGVYGLVAGIVKLDDVGYYLRRKSGAVPKSLGSAILFVAPYLMKTLSVVGTAAMFLVGGGILAHGFHFIDDFANGFSAGGGFWLGLVPMLIHFFVGIAAGAIVLSVITISKRILTWKKFRKS